VCYSVVGYWGGDDLLFGHHKLMPSVDAMLEVGEVIFLPFDNNDGLRVSQASMTSKQMKRAAV